MKAYVEDNIRFADGFIRERLPGITMRKPEATYLLWIDFRKTGLNAAELDDLIVHKAGLWLDSGSMFGPAGTGFQRINVCCPKSILSEAFERIGKALNSSEHR